MKKFILFLFLLAEINAHAAPITLHLWHHGKPDGDILNVEAEWNPESGVYLISDERMAEFRTLFPGREFWANGPSALGHYAGRLRYQYPVQAPGQILQDRATELLSHFLLLNTILMTHAVSGPGFNQAK